MDGAVGDPGQPPSPELTAVAVLARIGAVLLREEDAAKAVGQALALAVPAVINYCEVRQASYQAEGVLPWPPLAAGAHPHLAAADDVVAQVLATGISAQVAAQVATSAEPQAGQDGSQLLVAPLRSRAKVTGTLLVGATDGAWQAGFADALAALIALRLDADPHTWEHGAVAEARLALSARPQSAAVARSFVRDVLVRAGLAAQVDTAVLLVSELVSNALRHGVGPYHLVVVCDDDGTSVSVADRSPASPRPRRPVHDMIADAGTPAIDPSRLDEDGRGLLLVEALADDWGWTAATSGKRVWFRLAR